MIKHLQNVIFNRIVKNRLVYNTCWEDPRIDRELMDIDSESRILMLTSAGCNAFDYLLDNPAQIVCIDQNPAQNALLEFKLALFQNGSHNLLWAFFGKGVKKGAELIYQRQIRQYLSKRARYFWDRRIMSSFTSTSEISSFYYRGTSGKFALLIRKRIRQKGLYPLVKQLLQAKSLDEQNYYYNEIEPEFWDTFHKWIIRRRATLTMLGIPAGQQKMITRRYEGGIPAYLKNVLRHVFTGLPVRDNYFWRVYLTGSYTPDCCPNYLKKDNYNTLHKREGHITSRTTGFTDYLLTNNDRFTHFVLLDHLDWLVHTDLKKLEEKWRLIFGKAMPGAQILFRSASPDASFLPGFVMERLSFKDTKSLHKKDRTGTYESVHLAEID